MNVAKLAGSTKLFRILPPCHALQWLTHDTRWVASRPSSPTAVAAPLLSIAQILAGARARRRPPQLLPPPPRAPRKMSPAAAIRWRRDRSLCRPRLSSGTSKAGRRGWSPRWAMPLVNSSLAAPIPSKSSTRYLRGYYATSGVLFFNFFWRLAFFCSYGLIVR